MGAASCVLCQVALRKESVDRNYYSDKDADWVRVSLSARRAWIEIKTRSQPSRPRASLSARRAWIEIVDVSGVQGYRTVALRKESVDRNCKTAKNGITKAVALRKESVDRNT